METTKKYSDDVLKEAEALAKLMSALPKEKAKNIAEVANAYLTGANACLRIFIAEDSTLLERAAQ